MWALRWVLQNVTSRQHLRVGASNLLLQLASGHGRWMLQALMFSFFCTVHPGSCTEGVHEVSAPPPVVKL